MDADTITLQEGDIYRWSYRDSGDDDAWGRYHCCSRIAVVRAGRLVDTYWSSGDGRTFRPEKLDTLNLTRIANFSDLERRPEYEADYYDDADIVNLNHSNNTKGNFYLRKGAKRSAQKMRAVATRELERAESDVRMAISRAQRYQNAIVKIDAGEIEFFL